MSAGNPRPSGRRKVNYPPQSGGPGDGVVIPVSSLPTHEGAEIARLTRALADSADLVLAGAERVVAVEAERDEALDRLRLATGERDKFSSALGCMHAQQMRTEAERDEARVEVARLRGLIDGVASGLEIWRTMGGHARLVDAACRAVDERSLP